MWKALKTGNALLLSELHGNFPCAFINNWFFAPLHLYIRMMVFMKEGEKSDGNDYSLIASVNKKLWSLLIITNWYAWVGNSKKQTLTSNNSLVKVTVLLQATGGIVIKRMETHIPLTLDGMSESSLWRSWHRTGVKAPKMRLCLSVHLFVEFNTKTEDILTAKLGELIERLFEDAFYL